jgi:hypothetical protein
MIWQVLNSGSALAAAFVIGSLIGAAAIIFGTVRALQFVLDLLSKP